MSKPVRGFVALSPGYGRKTHYPSVVSGDELRLTYYPTGGDGDEPIILFMRRLPEGVDDDAGKIAVVLRVERRDGRQEALFEGLIDQPQKAKERR